MRSRSNTCKHITWCRKVEKTVIWWPRKTNETNCFKVKTWGGFNLTILKVNKSTMIEWKITIDLNSISKAPQVELTNTTMCNSDSTDSSILDLLNTNSLFVIISSCWSCSNNFRSIDSIGMRMISGSDFERRRHNTFISHKSISKIITKCLLEFSLNIMWNRFETLITYWAYGLLGQN